MADVLALKGLERSAQVIVDDISHAAVGTGTTAPNKADTQLVTETDRVATTKRVRQGTRFQQRTFFTNANLPTTLEETGWFMNGTGAADSGELLERSTFTFTKGTQDLLVILEIELQES